MKTLKLTQSHSVVSIELNRPEKRNAFQPEMISELTQTFTDLAQEASVRAIVVSGAGATFCAGGDAEWMRSMAKFTREENLKDAEALFDMFNAIRTCPIPVIGKIHGHAMGGGLGIVALCDVVAAETKTVFCFSEVKIGLVPSVISPFVREKLVPARASEWMITAKVFNASEAMQAGLVHHVGDFASVDAYIENTLQLLNNAAPGAVRDTKKLLLAQSHTNWVEMRKLTSRVISERRVSDEGQKGLKAFLDKKTPDWGVDFYGTKPKA